MVNSSELQQRGITKLKQFAKKLKIPGYSKYTTGNKKALIKLIETTSQNQPVVAIEEPTKIFLNENNGRMFPAAARQTITVYANQTPNALHMHPELWWNMMTSPTNEPIMITTQSLDKIKTCNQPNQLKIQNLLQNIQKNGLHAPIVVRIFRDAGSNKRKSYIHDGNLRLEAMRKLGAKSVPVHFEKTNVDHSNSQSIHELRRHRVTRV